MRNYKFIIDPDSFDILKIQKYNIGFNSVSCIVEKYKRYEICGITEITYSDYVFSKYSASSYEDIMLIAIKLLTTFPPRTTIDIQQRLYEYTMYLRNKFPEKLI